MLFFFVFYISRFGQIIRITKTPYNDWSKNKWVYMSYNWQLRGQEMARPIRLWLNILWKRRMCRRRSHTDIPKMDSFVFKVLLFISPSSSSCSSTFCLSVSIWLYCKGLEAKRLLRWAKLWWGVSGEKFIALLDLAGASFGDMQAIISSSSEVAGL